MHSELGEVKFVTGIWMCFSFDPIQVQPQNRYRLFGWMSTAHWNGSVFRSGEIMNIERDIHEEETDAELDDHERSVMELDRQIQELQDRINREKCKHLEDEFLETVL